MFLLWSCHTPCLREGSSVSPGAFLLTIFFLLGIWHSSSSPVVWGSWCFSMISPGKGLMSPSSSVTIILFALAHVIRACSYAQTICSATAAVHRTTLYRRDCSAANITCKMHDCAWCVAVASVMTRGHSESQGSHYVFSHLGVMARWFSED